MKLIRYGLSNGKILIYQKETSHSEDLTTLIALNDYFILFNINHQSYNVSGFAFVSVKA